MVQVIHFVISENSIIQPILYAFSKVAGILETCPYLRLQKKMPEKTMGNMGSSGTVLRQVLINI